MISYDAATTKLRLVEEETEGVQKDRSELSAVLNARQATRSFYKSRVGPKETLISGCRWFRRSLKTSVDTVPSNSAIKMRGVLTAMPSSVIRKEVTDDKLTIVNYSTDSQLLSLAARTMCYVYPRTLTTFRFPFPLGIPPAAPGPSVAFMPARMVSISTPDGNAGECADTRDLRAS